MMLRGMGILSLLGGLAALPLFAAADKLKPRSAAPDLASLGVDYQDFVFMASDRPVLVRLHVRNDGRPYSAPWDDYMKKFFAYFDRNKDGMLSKAEAKRAPNARFLESHLQGAIGFPYQGQTAPLVEMDTNKDGKVSQAEFADYYRSNGFGPFQFYSNSSRPSTDAVTNTLYKYLDTNKDRKLSAEEMAKAPTVLQRLDLDEDEMLTLRELSPSQGDDGAFFVQVEFAADGPMKRTEEESEFLEIKPNARDGLARQVLTHYDKDKNGKLSRTEIGLDKALFDKLDANRDGQLDAKEFAGFFQHKADLELIVRIGKLEQKENLIVSFVRGIGLSALQPIRAEVFNPSKRNMPLAGKVERRDPSTLAFALGDTHIELSVDDQSFARLNAARQFYAEQFKMADTKKKGVIDRKQAMSVDFLDRIFPLVDGDGDSKLTKKELNAYLDMQEEGSGCRLILGVMDRGRSLFDLVDANHDGRLSIRELRMGWSRMKLLARSEHGLSHKDIPRRLEVSIGREQPRFRSIFELRIATVRALGRGKNPPLWFVKMDRNRDGDLSPREFIGSEEDFRKIDADGDGLISVEEARKFEKELNKTNPKSEVRNPK
jgi:Ca2+-binding EF-hand superfamily protein